MTNIQQTIEQALPSGAARDYQRYVTPVVEALTEREQAIKDSLREYAMSRGLRSSDVDSLFREVGLEAGGSGQDGDLETRVAELENLVSRLRDAARARGLSV